VGKAAAKGQAKAEPEMRESVTTYLTIRITDPMRSMDIYKRLYQMEGVQRCEAVRGDFDIIVLAQAASQDEIKKLKDRIGAMDGIQLASVSDVERPKLDRDVNEFVDIYSQAVKAHGLASSSKQPGTTSYIIVDIDKNAIQQIFTTVFFIDEVVFCDVIENGTKLVGMVTGQGAVGKMPRIIEKLSQIDGVLRVREATVIKLVED
jgi:hypothetical protein